MFSCVRLRRRPLWPQTCQRTDNHAVCLPICYQVHGNSVKCQAFVRLEACQRLGLKVPDQISVLSIDNEEAVCENTRPTLSSIELDFQAGGYRAASRLFDLLTDGTGTVPFNEIGYGMSRLVERRSTSALTGSARIVAAAQDYIRRHACEGISPTDVAAELNLSPRQLQLRFRETLGHTPLDEIQRVRLETACDLLRTTRLPLATVAARSGFATLHHLQNIFTRARSCSMTAWRQGKRNP